MSEKGFATILLLIWAKVLLILLLGFAWTFWFLNQSKRMDNLCHEGVLKAQEQLVFYNNQIMALNFRARMLYLEKKALDVTILFGPPPAKAAAQARKKLVVAEQHFLRKTQQAFFKAGQGTVQYHLLRLRGRFYSRTKEIGKHWRSDQWFLGQISIEPKNSQLRVDWQDIAPTYKREDQHPKNQSMSARWVVPIRSALPLWLTRFVPVQSVWKGECFSHPHPGGFQWSARIGKGNH